jgi:hypothetical protein
MAEPAERDRELARVIVYQDGSLATKHSEREERLEEATKIIATAREEWHREGMLEATRGLVKLEGEDESVAVALRSELERVRGERDRLWSAAIVATQRGQSGRLTCDVEELLRWFNEHRPEPPAEPENGEPK